MFLPFNEDDLGERQERKITSIINSDFIIKFELLNEDSFTIIMADGEKIVKKGTMEEVASLIGSQGIKLIEKTKQNTV